MPVKTFDEIAPAAPSRVKSFEEIKPVAPERPKLIVRGLEQFVNKFLSEPTRTILTEGGLGKFDTALRMAESGRLPKPAKKPRKFSFRELGAAIRESNELALEVQKETRKAAEEFVPAFEVPPAEKISEKAVDVVAGVSAFIGRLVATRKLLGIQRGDFAGSVVAWETENIATGGSPGTGAAMRLALGGIDSVPAITMVGKTLKLGAESSLFGGITAAAGGDWEDIAMAAMIPLAFKAWNVSARGIAKGRAKRAIKNFRTEGKRYGINLDNVPDQALDAIINAGKQAGFWNKQHAKGKVTDQVYEQRLSEIRDGIKPVIIAVARQQPIKPPTKKPVPEVAEKLPIQPTIAPITTVKPPIRPPEAITPTKPTPITPKMEIPPELAKLGVDKLTTIRTSIGQIVIPIEELDVKWDRALEVVFDYGNQTAAGKPVQPGLPRSLSVGDTVEYEGKTWLVMPTGWQDVSHLSKEGIDKLVGEMKIPIPPKPIAPEPVSRLKTVDVMRQNVERYGMKGLQADYRRWLKSPESQLLIVLALSGFISLTQLSK